MVRKTKNGLQCAARAMLIIVGIAVMAVPIAAQETVSYASISGRVTDQQGAVVQHARVRVRQLATNITAEATTDDEGRFRFPYLRVGVYELVASAPGFGDATRQLTLTIGSAFELPITLGVQGVAASVDVTAAAPVLEAARSQIAGTVSRAEIDTLPMNGRNFLDVALLVPGVTPTNTASTQLFNETSAVAGPGLSINSQRNFSNNFTVDGLSANDDAAGFSGIPAGVDAVEQFQVVTSGGQAELGRALGGYVNVVTKSGTNTPHFDFYDFARDTRFNASNPLSGTKLPMTQWQWGASAGGPIRRDRTFFFTNVEQRRLDQSGLVTIADANVAAINARLAAVGYQAPLVTTGQYPNPVHTTTFLAKLDHQVSGRDLLALRYNVYDASSTNSRGAGGLNAPSASAALDNLDQAIAVANTLTLSSRMVNETRAQFAYSDLSAPSTDLIGPAVTITGVATFGILSGSPQARLNKLFQVVDNLSYQAGAHAFRVGTDFSFNADTITYPRSIRGSYTFSSLANFLAGVYNNSNGFTQTFGQSVVSQTNPNVGVYAQDEWKMSPRLTLNAGLRYDLQFIETITTDANNISPRVGLAWSPFESRRTVVRGSAGLYFDRVPLRAVANALLSAGNTTDLANLRQTSVSLGPTQASAPAFPNILAAAVPTVTLFNLTTMDRNLQNAASRQFSTEVEQQLGRQATVSIGYQYLRGANLLMQVNQNVPTCAAQGTNNGCRPISTVANISQYSSVGESNYHALHVTFLQRPAAWGNYRVTYTLSKSMNDVGENFFNGPIDNFDFSKDWGRSDDDQRHRLVVFGSLSSPATPPSTRWQQIGHGFQVSGTLQWYSALPLNITSGVNTIQGTAGRPIVNGAFIDRNSGTGPDFFSLNLRVSRQFLVGRSFKIEGLAEGFNLTNRANAVTINGNFGAGAYPTNPSPAFGQVTAVGDPRSLQLGVRIRY